MNQRIPGLANRRPTTPAPIKTQQGSVTIKPPAPPRRLEAKPLDLDEAIRRDCLSEIRRGEEGLDELFRVAANGREERIRLPESIFRRNFLPFINGEAFKNLPEGWTEEQARQFATEKWIHVAHGQTNEVDVVEPNGEVAFTMPAFSPMDHLNIAHPSEGPTLRHFAQRYDENRRTSGRIARFHLAQGVKVKMEALFSGVDQPTAHVEQLEKMRKYYGIDKSSEEKASNAANGGGGLSQLGEMQFD